MSPSSKNKPDSTHSSVKILAMQSNHDPTPQAAQQYLNLHHVNPNIYTYTTSTPVPFHQMIARVTSHRHSNSSGRIKYGHHRSMDHLGGLPHHAIQAKSATEPSSSTHMRACTTPAPTTPDSCVPSPPGHRCRVFKFKLRMRVRGPNRTTIVRVFGHCVYRDREAVWSRSRADDSDREGSGQTSQAL